MKTLGCRAHLDAFLLLGLGSHVTKEKIKE